MKKFTKTLSIVLLVAMCVSMFTISSFAVDAECPVCKENGVTGTISAHSYGIEPDCDNAGEKEHHRCPTCNTYFWDAAGTEIIYGDVNAQKVIPAKHTLTYNEGTPASCGVEGVVKHYRCGICGKAFSDAEGKNQITTGIAALDHNYELVAKEPSTCTVAGVDEHYRCSICGDLQKDGKSVTLADLSLKLADHDYTTSGQCKYCEAEDPSHAVMYVSGANPAEFSNTGVYVYDTNHEIESVTAGGYELYDGKGFYYANGKVTVQGSAIASLIGTDSSIELVFYAEDGCSVGGITLNNATTVTTLRVDGFEQKGFISGSTESVFFTTNDSNPNNVKLYNSRTGKYVDIFDCEMDALGGGEYTYTFTKAFLDTLKEGTYYARAFYGDGKYVSVGTIIISDSTVTVGSSPLTFSNSTVNTKEFKYVSGGTRPELYCEMFRDDDAVLQISNDGYSWKDVSVYDYYIEQSNGKSTSYAWIKTTLLDNQKAASNIYFRVIIPASARGANTDAISNWVKVTNGNTLRAVDTDKHVINSSKSLKFVSSAPVDVVKVGNIALVEGEDFAMSKDGKSITLFADFLNKRTAGSTYTLTAITEDGEELKTTFKILTTAQASASPRTGDDSNIALWSALVLMSGAAVVAVLPRLKKEN